ncbi:MAG: Uma2 family endonuclease [Candidatus Riflebacteria bacterium]|nr:Uma2 family endonuclease [Candidatus Riflebacteria bacterium]
MKSTRSDAVATRREQPVTAERLLELVNVGRCELVKGSLMMMSPSGRRHGKLTAEIARVLGNHVAANHLGEVSGAETGFILSRDPDTVRAPDVAFVAAARIPVDVPEDGFWPIAPDLAVEVVSPSDRWSEVVEKAREWLSAGVRLVWIVDPRSRTAHVYRPGREVLQLGKDELLEGGDVLPGFSVRIADLVA